MLRAGSQGPRDGGETAPSAAGPAVALRRAPRWSPLRFDGRLGRTEFALFVVAWHVVLGIGAGVAISVPLALVAAIASGGTVTRVVGVTVAAAFLIYLAGLASFGVRRLHDMGRSGRWLLLGLVPVVGLAIAVPLLLVPGSEGPNAFGERETAALVPTTLAPVTVTATTLTETAAGRPPAAGGLEDAYEAGRRFAERQRGPS
jgi:uncharacterized membrane protein YhaH (DUF805 family)